MITRNEGANLIRTVENLDDTLNAESEIVVVDDASTDGSADAVRVRRGRVRVIRAHGVGVTRARNLGARKSRRPVLVFADAHLELPKHWWEPLVNQLQHPDVGAVAPVITNTNGTLLVGHGLTFRGPDMSVTWLDGGRRPSAVPILPGCCLAMRRDVFFAAGCWDEGLLHRGNVDNELSIRLWLLGYRLLITPATSVGHLFRRRSPYRAGWAEYIHNRLRLAFVHFKPERIAAVIGALREHPFFGEAMLLLAGGDSVATRAQLFAQRVRDDDWFFERFGLTW